MTSVLQSQNELTELTIKAGHVALVNYSRHRRLELGCRDQNIQPRVDPQMTVLRMCLAKAILIHRIWICTHGILAALKPGSVEHVVAKMPDLWDEENTGRQPAYLVDVEML